MKMLRIVFVLFLVGVAMLMSGCTNKQSSSMEEAKYVVEHQPDCEKVTNYLNISSGSGLVPPDDPLLYRSDPKIAEGQLVVIHEIIYKKKGLPEFCLVLLDDEKPPKIVAKIDIGKEPPAPPKGS